MAARLELVESGKQTTDTLERARPIEAGNPLLGTALVVLAASSAGLVYLSYRHVDGFLAWFQALWHTV